MNDKLALCLKITVLYVLFSGTILQAQDVRVVLTGNTADLTRQNDLFTTISRYCAANAGSIAWVLNGDVFPAHYTADSLRHWQQAAHALLEQYPDLQLVVGQGDRDWSASGRAGWQHVLNTEEILQKKKHKRLHVFIGHGCPGPWVLPLGQSLNIVAYNSQWWNHPYDKPTPYDGQCPYADTDIFIEELEGILDDNARKNLLLLAHFPLESLGRYGGRRPLSDYLLPPIVGSAIAGFHQNVGNTTDIANSRYAALSYKLQGTLQNYASLIVASGHEQNQSIMAAGQNYLVNSGAPAQGRYAAHHPPSQLASAAAGFIEIQYRDNGEVRYRLLDHTAGPSAQEGTLFYTACQAPADRMVNTRIPTCAPEAAATPAAATAPAMTPAVAGASYASGPVKELWFGKHYRYSWTRTVDVPVLNMDTTHGGLTVTGKGGGRQTTSIKLAGNDGREYVFRSVDKDPSRELDFQLRGTLVSEVLKDQTTTQQPYGALAVSHLLDKVGILHASPQLYVLPDDDHLGSFREKYKHLYGMLEERPTDAIAPDKVFGGAKHIEKSYKMFTKLHRDHDNRVDTQEFARARIFDLWIGDWSKHEDNWKWAGYPADGGGEVFRPVPRDRDHAFSRWDGIIPWIADREWGVPNGENFDYRIHGLKSLMFQARYMDRFVASEVTREQWVQAARDIQAHITGQDIEQAVRRMPAAVYEPDGRIIEAKLKARLKDLPQYAAHYYALLATIVEVVGSNKKEFFHVRRQADGTVQVTLYDLTPQGEVDSTKVYYNRTFYPAETKEIRLFGLAGDDRFLIEGQAEHSILVRIINNEGHKTITDRSRVAGRSHQTLVYEKNQNATLDLGAEAKRITPKDDRYYAYDRRAFAYHRYMPLALVAYNPFTGVALHGGVSFTRQHFGKPQFSTIHTVSGSVTTEGNYEVSYSNRLRYLVGKWDGISELTVSRPLTFNYFFGMGNSSVKDNDRPKNYYRTQYNLASASIGLTRTFWNKSHFTLTANYEFDEGVKRHNSYVEDHPDMLGVARIHIGTLKGNLDLDFRDRVALPEHGFRLLLNQTGGYVSSPASNYVSISEVEIENYFSTYNRNPITLGLRIGGGTTHGDLPFYKLLSLGQLDNLNGFKRNRFTGQSRAYLNSELRWQLTRTEHTLIPLKIGLRGFFDTGRVWADSDPDSADFWHYGYGGGFYITPFREQFAFNISASSSQEESLLLMFSIGSFLR